MPLYFTEWSTSYTPRDPVHDSYVSAPYILSKLKGSEGHLQGMSYWTYSDLFEEPGPPTAPFEGGFGLMNPQGIRKPAWFAYKYLNQLGDKAVKVADAQTWVTADAGGVQALVWDFRQPVQAVSNRPYYTKVLPTSDVAPISLDLKGLKPGRYDVRDLPHRLQGQRRLHGLSGAGLAQDAERTAGARPERPDGGQAGDAEPDHRQDGRGQRGGADAGQRRGAGQGDAGIADLPGVGIRVRH